MAPPVATQSLPLMGGIRHAAYPDGHGSGSPCDDMVDNPEIRALVNQIQVADTTINYTTLNYLKWSPRRQPERAPEFWRAARDALDRAGLTPIVQGKVPTALNVAEVFPTLSYTSLQSVQQLLLARWWELNTAVYHLLSAAVVFDGPLQRSDLALIEQRFVNGMHRNGRGFAQWLSKFGNDATIKTQQDLRLRFDTAALSSSADAGKLQAHCDAL